MQTRIRFMEAVLMAAAFLFSGPLLADQIVMQNGDIITGNISKIEDDKIYIEPTYADEFSVKIAEVASINASQNFEVELADGSKVKGSFVPGEDGEQILVIEGEAMEIDVEEIAEATEPEDWYDWTSHVDVNLTWNDGNTDSRNNLVYADTSLKLGDHRHKGNITFTRDKTDDVYTKKQDLLNYSYNWLFADPWFMGGSLSYERDPIRELNHRYTIGLLVGRDIFNDANRYMAFSFGPGWSEEDFEQTESDSGATALWNFEYTQDFRDGDFEFFHNHNLNYQFFGQDNAIFKSNTGFRFDIIDDIYANVSLRYDYETEPTEGAENKDTSFVVGVGAKF